MIKLAHHAVYDPDWNKILLGVVCMQDFVKNIKSVSKSKIPKFKPDDKFALTADECQNIYNKHVGDYFEVFVEMLLNSMGHHHEIGIGEYKPLPSSVIDTGVDGTGIGTNLKPAAVQCKFRSSYKDELTANKDHLGNLVSTGQNVYGVEINDRNNMLVVTTAKDIHSFTKQHMLFGKVRCIGYDNLKDLVDGNLMFWRDFQDSINNA